MATVTLKGGVINTNGELPKVGTAAPDFTVVKNDLSEVSLADYKGKNIIVNIFPSIDTGVCASSVRHFNKDAASLENTVVLCISADLPFAQARFCGAEGIDNVETASVFRCSCFADNYGVLMIDGPLKGLLARSVVVINSNGEVVYTELVPEIAEEPNYKAALEAVK